ncbi:hypothetical protein SAMN04489742_0133 [Arthrobacter crystallopoietes]|uniref:Uncharacterized protein n=1 Tax=Crystallibacter crystallopoietes TaxID=37928 RepID=A0A1H0XLB0_9MICC|nr:hypothetical protein SAMN04489742_0133 [Arthrobacter crystallopoietes]
MNSWSFVSSTRQITAVIFSSFQAVRIECFDPLLLVSHCAVRGTRNEQLLVPGLCVFVVLRGTGIPGSGCRFLVCLGDELF